MLLHAAPSPSVTRPAKTAAHARMGNRIRSSMVKRGYTAASLGREMGVSGTQVSYWRCGVYIPPPDRAQDLAELLDDPRIVTMVNEARMGRCPVDGVPFDRGQSRREYCSSKCQVRANNPRRRVEMMPDPKQDAIDAMCRGCEPEGVCRDDGCALRPFSPLSFIPLHRVA